jgi:hypothetical protein
MKVYILSLINLLVLSTLNVKTAQASCPVCIVTVGGGLLLAQKFGIDDLIVTLWISGLNTAIAFFLADKIKKPNLNNPYLWSVFLFVSTLIYLYTTNQAGIGNNFLGIDKSLLGLSLGMLLFFISVQADKLIRQNNNGKVLFYYQRVIIPVVALTLATAILYQFV